VRRDFVARSDSWRLAPTRSLRARLTQSTRSVRKTPPASRWLAGSDQPDEIGSLVNSFAEVERYLGTVSAQAESLAAQEFDDPALDEDVPGAFGDSLDEMAANLEAYTTGARVARRRLRRRGGDARVTAT